MEIKKCPRSGLYIEAPNSFSGAFNPNDFIFLGGPISGAHDWQKGVAKKLLPFFNVVNPRRVNYDCGNPELEREQITWEYYKLTSCGHTIFYFGEETLAPITLLELGKELGKISLAKDLNPKFKAQDRKKIYICIHPKYKRKSNVLIQTELAAPELLNDTTFDLDITLQKIIGYRLEKLK